MASPRGSAWPGFVEMRVILWVTLLLWRIDVYASVTEIDDFGYSVTLESQPERIVSLAPHLTELLFSLGVGGNIIATVAHSDYPPAAQLIPRLGDAFSLSVESIVDISPDLIVAWGSGGNQRTLARLRELGYSIYLNEVRDLEGIGATAARLGILIGRREVGEQLEIAFLEELARLNSESPMKLAPSVFFQISDQQLYTVSDDHLIGQAIRVCNARNIFGDLDLAVPMVSLESLVSADPDLILVASPYEGFLSSWSETWQRLNWQNRVRYVDASLVTRPGLRMLRGIESMCKSIGQPD